ncbi:hypothetical protein BHM03_00006611 [Ensete ventricosum]|nr:hypothetical protein BHM03_00006611 [Ensete ventricosum]
MAVLRSLKPPKRPREDCRGLTQGYEERYGIRSSVTLSSKGKTPPWSLIERRPRKPRKTSLHPALRSPDMKEEENPEHQNGDPSASSSSSSSSSSSTARSPEFLTETKDQSSSTSRDTCSSQDAIAMKEDSPAYHNDDSASLYTVAQDPELPTETQEQRCGFVGR